MATLFTITSCGPSWHQNGSLSAAVNAMPTDRAVRGSSALKLLVAAVLAAGGLIIVESAFTVHSSGMNLNAVALAALTLASTRFRIKVPGRPATVSVSEVFVFSSVLLFGPAVPVLTVAADGLWVSMGQKNRRVRRALFNMAEPAISTWTAAHVFFAIVGVPPGSSLSSTTPVIVPATVAMAAAFFALNSGLSAFAVALETGGSAYDFWRSHAWYLAVNYYAAASLATLAVSSAPQFNFGVAGLILPLLLLSYVAYREASSRVHEAHSHMTEVEHLYRASVEMLAIAVDAKDQVTHGHIRRVQRHTLAVAAALGVTDSRELKAIEAGALLHDIGKLAVPDYVLNKPTALTREEFEIIKKHPSMGARILTAVEFPYPIVPIVRHHHEQWNGRGYPDGLVASEIPLGARILAVVDCFDALTSDRPYRQRLTDDQAIAILRERQGTFYDPAVVDRFVELVPSLRREDAEASEEKETHASVIAGMSRTAADLAVANPDAPATVVPIALSARELIDDVTTCLGRTDACLFTLNASQDALVVAYATPRLRAAVSRLAVPVGAGVSGWVAANRSSIRHADPTLDFGRSLDGLGLRSCTSVPVFVRADLFGVLTAYRGEATECARTVEAVGLLAQEVGLTIARESAAGGHAKFQLPKHLVAAS
jgi:putative nucleotidyltransferase with HDIG domain